MIRCVNRCCKETSNGVSILLMDRIMEFFWEPFTRSILRILHILLLEQTIDDEGSTTLVCEVEKILNSRPITVVSENSRDLEPLTPNHLLWLKSDTTMAPGVFQKTYFPGVDGGKFDIFQIFLGKRGLMNTFHFFEIVKNGCIPP